MAQDTPQNEIQAFYAFLGQQLHGGKDNLTPEQSVREFRACQEELANLQKKPRDAEASTARGESKPLDIEALKQRVRDRLAEAGIAE